MEPMIARVIRREGGYANVPGDRGGCTKYGITLKTFREDRGMPDLTCENLQQLTQVEAADIYRRRYLSGPHIDAVHNAGLRELLFDSAIQHGPDEAFFNGKFECIKWLQAAVGAVQDGQLGPKTLAHLNACDPKAVFSYVFQKRLRFYGGIVVNNPQQLKFLDGWLNRMGALLTVCLTEL